MTVGEIIQAVRWCYDEEQMDGADFHNASSNDNTLMDNIIKSKIGDAVRWICLYSPAELLGGSDVQKTVGSTTEDVPTGILVDAEVSSGSTTDNGVELVEGLDCYKLIMPSDFIKLARVRVNGWHRAIKTPIAEDSDEYLQLYDDNGATATDDRPIAAIIDKSRTEIELWPTPEENIHVLATYVSSVSPVGLDANGDPVAPGTDPVQYALPPRVKTAFIYYLAFLVLSAYEDSRAARMLDIAKMNIGKNG